MPIELFNPLARVSVGSGVDVEQLGHEAHMFGELVGLGLRDAETTGIKIDLVPAAVQSQRDSTKRRPFLIGAAALFLLGVGAWAGYQVYASGVAAQQADAREADLSELQPPANQLKKMQGEISRLENVGRAYAQTQFDRVEWIDLVNELNGYFARDNVWITDLQAVSGYKPGDPKSGESAIKDKFSTAKYGDSIFAGKGAKGLPANVNAIRVSGYWRKSREMQNAVNEVLQLIREGSAKQGSAFRLSTQSNKGDKPATLKDDQIFQEFVTTLGNEGKLAAPFTMVLPLSQPIKLK